MRICCVLHAVGVGQIKTSKEMICNHTAQYDVVNVEKGIAIGRKRKTNRRKM